MDINDIYRGMTECMERMLRDFEAGLSETSLVDLGGGHKVIRFKTQDLSHAIVMKLAVIVSGLNAAIHLSRSGHVYEQGILHRTVDDANEDVFFLVLAATRDEITHRHQRFLDSFWAEEVGDASDVLGTHKSRDIPKRDKIRAHNTNETDDPSTANKAASIVYKSNSGFVHGAAPHIMDMFDPRIPGFSVIGMLGTPRSAEYRYDLWNYVYRAGLSFMAAAKAFGSQDHVDVMKAKLDDFQSITGRDGGLVV